MTAPSSRLVAGLFLAFCSFLPMLALADEDRSWDSYESTSEPPERLLRSREGRILWRGALGQARFSGHGYDILAVAVSHDGRRIVSSGADGTMRVWDAESGLQERIILLDGMSVVSIGVREGGDHAWAATSDDKYLDCDLVQGSAQVHTCGSENVSDPATLPGMRVLGISGDGLVLGLSETAAHVWSIDLSSGYALHHAQATVVAAATASDGRSIALADADGRVILASKGGGGPFALEKPSGKVAHLSLSPDGRWLAAATDTGSVLVWDTGERAAARTLDSLLHHEAPATRVAFSTDGSRLLAGNSIGAVTAYATEDWRILEGLALGGEVTAVACSPQGDRIVFGHRGGRLTAWDLSVTPARTQGEHRTATGGHDGVVDVLAVSRDGASAISASEGDGTVMEWNVATGAMTRVHPIEKGSHIRAARFCPNGTWLLHHEARGFHALIGPPEARRLEVPSGPYTGTSFLDLSDDGVTQLGEYTHRVILPGGQVLPDPEVSLIESATGRQVRGLVDKGHRGHVVRAGCFLGDSGRFATADDSGTLCVWEASGERARVLQGLTGDRSQLIASGSGAWLVHAAGGSLRCWRMDREMPHSDLAWPVNDDVLLDVCMGRGDDTLLVAGRSGWIREFDLGSGSEVDSIRVDSVPASLAPHDGGFLVGTGSGLVYKYEWAD